MLCLMIMGMEVMVMKSKREAMDMRKKMDMVMVKRRKITMKRRDMINMVIKSIRTNSLLRKIIQVWTRV